eukprot:scaffold9068_cov72-Phaeocystis_antarctica.AAC.1
MFSVCRVCVTNTTRRGKVSQDNSQVGTALDVAIASCTATLAASLAGVPPIKSVLSAGSAPLPSAAARAAQPASETWVLLRSSHLSFVSAAVVGGGAPAGGGGAPAGGGGARRAKRPSSRSGLLPRPSLTSAVLNRKAGARATSPASPMAASNSQSLSSSGRAPRPRAAASAEAPASPTCVLRKLREVTTGSAPAPSLSASRCTASGPADLSQRHSTSSAGSTEPSEPSVAKSAVVRPLLYHSTYFASRSSLQLRSPSLRHNAAATS